MKYVFAVVAAFLLVAPLTGCSGGNPPVPAGIIVKGKVLKDGQPLPLPRADVGLSSLTLELVPSTGNEVEFTQAAEDGSFEFLGPGNGVKAAEYKLVIRHELKGPGTDSLDGRYSKEKTPIELTLNESQAGTTHDMGVIDVAKP